MTDNFNKLTPAETERLAILAEEFAEGMDLAKLRRLAAKIREDAMHMGPYGFSKATVLSIASIIEECTPAEPKPEGRKRLSELRVVVDYNLPADEVRVGPGAFSQLQVGLLEVDTFRGLK